MFESTKSRLFGAAAGLTLVLGSVGGVAAVHAQTPPNPQIQQPAAQQQVQQGDQNAPDTGVSAESATEAPEMANENSVETPEATGTSVDHDTVQSQVQQTGQNDGQY